MSRREQMVSVSFFLFRLDWSFDEFNAYMLYFFMVVTLFGDAVEERTIVMHCRLQIVVCSFCALHRTSVDRLGRNLDNKHMTYFWLVF